MFNIRIIAILLVLCCAAPVFAQESMRKDGSSGDVFSDRQIGIFMDLGFGFANNLRLSDWMNRMADIQEVALLNKEDESTRKEPLFYGGIDIEARFFSSNVVFAPSFGYYDVSQGYREVSNDTITFKQRVSLSFIALKTSIYYKISFYDGDFLLLGGGLGYYNGTLKHELGYYNVNGTETEESSKDSSWTIGVHTGLEYNIRFFDSFAVSLGFINRFAEAFSFDVNVGNEDDEDTINAGLVGIYLYTGCGYMF